MRRAPLALLAATLGLTLAACGGDAPEQPATGIEATADGTAGGGGAASAEGIASAEIVGGVGEQPQITFSGDPSADLVVSTLVDGGGDQVVAAGDFIVADYVGQVWGADTAFNDTWVMGGPIGFSLNQVIQGWSEGIPGAKVGDRIAISIPSEMGYPQGQPGAGIEAGDTLLFVIDVLGAYNAESMSGQADATPTGDLDGLPVTVSGDLGGPATVAVEAGAAEPTEPSATVIAEGTGEPVPAAGLIVVSFGAVGWDGANGGSSWVNGYPEAVPLGQGTIFDSLVGVPTGSRVVALLPASAQSPAVASVVDVVDVIPAR